MKQYHDCLKAVLASGRSSDDRTKTGTVRLSGLQARYDLSAGLPLITTKRLHLKSVIHELLWFLAGDTNTRYLKDHGVTIWDEWAGPDGSLGPVYGHQWRRFGLAAGEEGPPECDQIQTLIKKIKEMPYSRELVVSAWNPAQRSQMALPPCHTLFQVLICDGKLDLILYQRSADMFLGVPFNIACYALLAHMIAHVTGYEAGDFIHFMGDAHIYSNHRDQVDEQLRREPHPLPKLRFARQVSDLLDFRFEDFIIEGYDPDPAIKAPVAV